MSLALYLGAALETLRRRDLEQPVKAMLMLFAVGVAVWDAVLAGWRLNWYDDLALRPDFVARLPQYAALFSAWLFLQLSWAFLRRGRADWRLWALGGIWLIVALALDLSLPQLPLVLFSTEAVTIPSNGALTVFVTLGWAIMVGLTVILTQQAYRREHQPLHRNRLSYWVPVLWLIVLGGMLVLSRQVALGSLLRLVGAGIAAYVIFVHHLPDVRETVRLVLSALITALLMTASYVIGFVIVQTGLQARADYELVIAGTVLALGLVLVATPLYRQVQTIVNRWIAKTGYDSGRAVREYSLSISNILDVKELAQTALGIIHDALGAGYGALFLVDRKRDDSGEYLYWRSVGAMQAEVPASGRLAVDNPVAEYLFKEYQPISQYDIDLLPRFRGMAEAERDWLASLKMDVYVPIYSKGVLIGLLALGPKVSGDRYYNDDLTLLSTLADQTTVALENARLVDNLVRLNQTLRQAYRQLDQANQQLAHLDQAKSDFIAILSHELRTPLGIMIGYSQLLSDDPHFAQDPMYQPLMTGLQKGATRMQELVEAMLDMAMIDLRTLKLHQAPAPILSVIQLIADKLKPALEERKLHLELRPDLRRLPEIEADSDSLSKVFHHLIINAIKYTPDGGRITITGRPLPPGNPVLVKPGIELVISDTGIGIDPKYQELIFTKFYQTGEVAFHSTGKTKFKGGGPGLGLAIVRGIVEGHGGKVWVESPGYDEGNCPGSDFHVVLPLRQAERPADIEALG
jgi:signal transduction histidine kinase